MVITGGNSGIGLATAKALLEGGAQIVLACRNPSLADRAIEKLRQQVPNGGELVKLQKM